MPTYTTIPAPLVFEANTPNPLPSVPTKGSASGDYPYPVYVYGMPQLSPPPAAAILQATPDSISPTGWSATGWTPQYASILAQMLANTLAYAGNGIAGPQIGEPWRMFLMTTSIINNPDTGVWVADGDPWNPNGYLLSPNAPIIPGGNSSATYQVFINPVVTYEQPPTSTSYSNTFTASEGCLSIPGYDDQAAAPTQITTRATFISFSYTTLTYDENSNANGFQEHSLYLGMNQNGIINDVNYVAVGNVLSWIIQHETDHLNGILFTQRAPAVNSSLGNALLGGLIPLDNPLTPAQQAYLNTVENGTFPVGIQAPNYPMACIDGLVMPAGDS